MSMKTKSIRNVQFEETGLEDLDRQHEEIIAIAQAVESGLELGVDDALELFWKFQLIAKFHYYDEERLMVAYDFPDRKTHSEDHWKTLDAIRDLVDEFEENFNAQAALNNLVHLIKSYLEHVQVMDKALSDFIKKKQAASV